MYSKKILTVILIVMCHFAMSALNDITIGRIVISQKDGIPLLGINNASTNTKGKTISLQPRNILGNIFSLEKNTNSSRQISSSLIKKGNDRLHLGVVNNYKYLALCN